MSKQTIKHSLKQHHQEVFLFEDDIVSISFEDLGQVILKCCSIVESSTCG